VAQFESTPSLHPGGERDGVRGFELENKRLLIPAFSSIGDGGEGENSKQAATNNLEWLVNL
jgi:hypothetical protein